MGVEIEVFFYCSYRCCGVCCHGFEIDLCRVWGDVVCGGGSGKPGRAEEGSLNVSVGLWWAWGGFESGLRWMVKEGNAV